MYFKYIFPLLFSFPISLCFNFCVWQNKITLVFSEVHHHGYHCIHIYKLKKYYHQATANKWYIGVVICWSLKKQTQNNWYKLQSFKVLIKGGIWFGQYGWYICFELNNEFWITSLLEYLQIPKIHALKIIFSLYICFWVFVQK